MNNRRSADPGCCGPRGRSSQTASASHASSPWRHSRCKVVDVKIVKEDKQKLMAQFFKRVCWILTQENIEYNKEVVAQVIAKYYPDNRRTLNELQYYAASGTVDVGLLSQISDVNLSPLVKALKENSFSDVRKWLVDNLDNDSNTIYRKLYDNMYDILKPNSIPRSEEHTSELQSH